VYISVHDDGKGIQADLIAGLGKQRESHGKAGGSGLGLWHARTCVEAWGGRLEIESAVERGTTVSIILPKAQTPGRFVDGKRPNPELRTSVAERYDAVLIDDDYLARLNWKQAATRAGKKIRLFSSAADFFQEAPRIDRETKIYVDHELGDL